MSSGQDRTRHQDRIVKRYYEHRDTIAVQNVAEIASDLFLCDDPRKAARLWDRAAKALAHTDVDTREVDRIMAGRDIEGLTRLVNQLTSPARRSAGLRQTQRDVAPSAPPTPPPVMAVSQAVGGSASQPAADACDPINLKKAMKAFRKRLKLTRLDEESKLGVGPLTSGARSSVVAITPPNQFPTAVWEQLVAQGKLRQAGRGFYALAQE